MKKVTEFILTNILPKGSSYEVVEENLSEQSGADNVVKLNIKVDDSNAGLVVGKGGKVIKAIRNLLRINAVVLKKKVFVTVNS